jgi:hypothetical protein
MEVRTELARAGLRGCFCERGMVPLDRIGVKAFEGYIFACNRSVDRMVTVWFGTSL